MKKNRGFTLMELMIVVAIMGILGAVGYPAYINAVNKSNRADAIDSLLSLASRMEEYYLINDSYVGATVAADGSGTVGTSQTSASLYTLSIPSATAFGYSVTATPVGTDAECATISLNNLGQKSATGTDAANCW
jgi:type IV pilus assembly protein PilE